MGEGYPRPVVRLLTAVFALALGGLLAWLAYFASRTPGAVLEQVGDLGALLITAGLSGAVALTSGLLARHYGAVGYSAGEEVIFRVCLIVSTGIMLCGGVWALAIAVFS